MRVGRNSTGAAGIVVALLALMAPARADDAARQRLDEVRRLNETTRKWTDRTQRMALTVVDRRGGEVERELEVRSKRYDGDATRSIMFFHAPAQVRGIGFLQWTDPRETDRQWLWLPALKRVRQISGGSRSESFVGTDFSYEDLAIMAEAVDWSEAEAASTLAGEETLDGEPCDIIELRPTAAADVRYGVVRLWLGRTDHVVRKFELVDGDGTLVKTLRLSDIRIEKNIPTAYKMEMRNERAGSHTTVRITALAYDSGIADEELTQRRLEKGL